jgi:hypothetical protein
MHSVFTILNIEERIVAITGANRDSNTVNLLEHYTTLDLNTVLLSLAYYVKHSTQNIDAENMMWTQVLGKNDFTIILSYQT